MDLQVGVFQKGCDRCAWWAKELDDTRRRTGWFTLPKGFLDHLEQDHGARALVVLTEPTQDTLRDVKTLPNLREVTGR